MYPAGREVCYAVMKRFIPSCAQGVAGWGIVARIDLVVDLMCLGCHQHTLVTNYFVWDALFDHQNWMQVSHYHGIRSCCGFSPHGEALYRWRLGNTKLVVVSEGGWSLKQQSNS
jgi:hypothetical protein